MLILCILSIHALFFKLRGVQPAFIELKAKKNAVSLKNWPRPLAYLPCSTLLYLAGASVAQAAAAPALTFDIGVASDHGAKRISKNDCDPAAGVVRRSAAGADIGGYDTDAHANDKPHHGRLVAALTYTL